MFEIGNFITLGFLIMLQMVLGFDNLLYIALESKRAPEDKQNYVRNVGIGLAILLRIVLLFVIVTIIPYLQGSLFHIHNEYMEMNVTAHSLIVLFGGAFIIYTAIKEIWHMISLEDEHSEESNEPVSLNKIIGMIIVMNLVFSFDSILSAIALTDVFWVMAVAVVVSGLMMIYLSEKVTNFLKQNRMYEVLGLFVLFIVGIMLVTEGAHLAHMSFFGSPIEAMSKTTFYFVLVVLVIVDVVQGRYQKKIIMEQNRQNKDVFGA